MRSLLCLTLFTWHVFQCPRRSYLLSSPPLRLLNPCLDPGLHTSRRPPHICRQLCPLCDRIGCLRGLLPSLRPLERILSTGVRVTVTMCHSWPFPARDPPSGSLLGCKVRLPLSAEACRVLGRPAPPGCASSFPLCTAQAASSSHPRALGSSSAHTEALPG